MTECPWKIALLAVLTCLWKAVNTRDGSRLSMEDVKSKKIRVEFSMEDIDTDVFKRRQTIMQSWIGLKELLPKDS